MYRWRLYLFLRNTDILVQLVWECTCINLRIYVWCVFVTVTCVSDVNPLLKLGDLEQTEDVVQDTASSYLMCVSESWEKQSKEPTVGLVVRVYIYIFVLRNLNTTGRYGVSVDPFIWYNISHCVCGMTLFSIHRSVSELGQDIDCGIILNVCCCRIWINECRLLIWWEFHSNAQFSVKFTKPLQSQDFSS